MYIILITISTFQNPVSEIKKIASFLGKECSNTFAEEVAEKCNIENVRKAEEQIRNNEHAFVYRKGYYQPIKSIIHSNNETTFMDVYTPYCNCIELKYRPSSRFCALNPHQ